jgi:serine O-acetyltransferase
MVVKNTSHLDWLMSKFKLLKPINLPIIEFVQVEKLLNTYTKIVYNLTDNIAESITQLQSELVPLLNQLNIKNVTKVCYDLIEAMPEIKDNVFEDLTETYDKDPSSHSLNEILLCYPGLKATTYYRLAHQLYLQGVEILPRYICELIHSNTGIDIHPEATIGKGIVIDHGSGVVIGQTVIIGDYVRIYQGVTLGASNLNDPAKLRNTKRHPTIKDHVIIYAYASILGGTTIIGNNCVIGLNALVMKSLDDNTQIAAHSIVK